MPGKGTAERTQAYDVYIVGEQLRVQMQRASLIKDRRYHLRKYRKCFVGRDAVDWLVTMCHAQSRGEAVLSMRRLQEFGVLRHVVDDHVFKDQNLYFRFTRDDDRYLLITQLSIFYRGLAVFDSVRGARLWREVYQRGHLYQNAFYGDDLVDLLSATDHHNHRRHVADACQELLEHDIIRHVSGDHMFVDDRLLYQFGVDYGRPCLLSDVMQPKTPPIGVQPNAGPSPAIPAPGCPTLTPVASEGTSVDRSSTPTPGSLDSRGWVCGTEGGATDSPVRAGLLPPSWQTVRLEGEDVTMVKRSVNLRKDAVGYGLVLRGADPCYVHTIDPLGPAAAAGLKVGQLLFSVAGENVLHLDHRDVGRRLMTHSGRLTLVVLTQPAGQVFPDH